MLAVGVMEAQAQTSQPATLEPGPDPRPRVAVIGIAADAANDERDAWIPTALEELFARRLQRLPTLIVLPTFRLYQARSELTDASGVAPAWLDVVRGLGANYLVSGRCSGLDNALTMELTLLQLGEPGRAEQRVALPTGRLFEVLDSGTRWLLEQWQLPKLADELAARVFQPPSSSPTAVEYHARALLAMRAEKLREALRYAGQSLDRDPHFRPPLAVLAQIETQMGPAGRSSAARRLRVLSDLARLDGDPFDRVRAEIGQSLLLQADGAFDAALTRAETALSLAFEQRDVYGQMAAMTAMCDCYLLQTVPATPALSDAARDTFARGCLQRAAEWQTLEIKTLGALEDVLAGVPASNKLALIYERLDQPDLALELHKRTLAAAVKLGSERQQATAWLYLGQWYSGQKRWPEAIDAITHCLALAEPASQPSVRLVLGGVYVAMELRDEALAQFELAYEKVRHTEDLATQFKCLREIATLRMQLGRRDKAIAALEEAIDLAHVLELRNEKELRAELDGWKQGGT
jgi:tetratricopeptide (TPR) repeat protein